MLNAGRRSQFNGMIGKTRVADPDSVFDMRSDPDPVLKHVQIRIPFSQNGRIRIPLLKFGWIRSKHQDLKSL